LPAPMKGERLRVRVTASVGTPVLARFAAWQSSD